MTHGRLDALADGIFAIVMTLLVFHMELPNLRDPTNHELLQELHKLLPTFLSLILSFIVLFTYWRAHNFIITNLAKNLDQKLINYNAMFLFLVTLIPFSTDFLGKYGDTRSGVILYSLNIILLSFSLYVMRNYIVKAEHIGTSNWSPGEHRNSTVRMVFPMGCSALAIVVSFISPLASVGLFIVMLLFSLSGSAVKIIRSLVDPILPSLKN